MGRGFDQSAKLVPALFKLPEAERPLGGELVVGDQCTVYFHHLDPNVWWEHQHPQTQVKVFLDARGFVSFRMPSGRRIKLPLDGAQVWIVPPGVRHSLRLTGNTDLIAVYLERAFTAEATSQPLREPSLAPLERYVQADRLIADLVAVFRDLLQRPGPPRPRRVNFVALHGGMLGYRLLAAHVAPRHREAGTTSGLSEGLLNHMLAYIHGNFAQPLARAVLGREAGLSPWHFGRLFKMSTGKSPARYIADLRIERARALLAQGERTASAVAIDVGLAYNQLVAHFRRRYGVAPGAFRARMKRAQNRRCRAQNR